MQEIKTNPTVRHTTPLQLLAAFAATVAVLFVLLLPLTAVFICSAAGYVQNGRFWFARWQNLILYVSVAALVIFGVVRNLVRFL